MLVAGRNRVYLEISTGKTTLISLVVCTGKTRSMACLRDGGELIYVVPDNDVVNKITMVSRTAARSL
jgi:hypothetical protein